MHNPNLREKARRVNEVAAEIRRLLATLKANPAPADVEHVQAEVERRRQQISLIVEEKNDDIPVS